MFGKIIDLIVDAICGGASGKEAESRGKCHERAANTVSSESMARLNVNTHREAIKHGRVSNGPGSVQRTPVELRRIYPDSDFLRHRADSANGCYAESCESDRDKGSLKDRCDRKSREGMEAESVKDERKYSGILGALYYMNTRAEEANFGSGVTHEWVRRISLKVKDFCSRPIMLVLLVLMPFLYLVSPKAVVLVPFLVALGAVALVVQSYLPVYIGLDFSLMGAVLGSVLFHPWIGVLIVLCTYVAAMMFPNGNQDALEYERIFLFSFLALVIPYIPISDVMIKCVVATYIGEFMEMFWHKYGEDYPWIMAFLKVFPRSLLYVYVFHKTLVFLV